MILWSHGGQEIEGGSHYVATFGTCFGGIEIIFADGITMNNTKIDECARAFGASTLFLLLPAFIAWQCCNDNNARLLMVRPIAPFRGGNTDCGAGARKGGILQVGATTT